MSDWVEILENLAAMGTAVILGGLVGLERELRHQWAGMRTHMIVSLGAALFVLAMISYPNAQSGDVGRVIQGLVAGIGFLGAGTILKMTEKSEVKGLTTAASIWLAAAVGVACGLKEYPLAVSAVGIALIVLEVLRSVARAFDRAAGIDRHDPDEHRAEPQGPAKGRDGRGDKQ
jgi:putative Mg2+ transporter-C (MgtC) family protein